MHGSNGNADDDWFDLREALLADIEAGQEKAQAGETVAVHLPPGVTFISAASNRPQQHIAVFVLD